MMLPTAVTSTSRSLMVRKGVEDNKEMKGFIPFIRGMARAIPTCLLLVLPVLAVPSPVLAQGGVAISGTFYRQNFEIPQGSSASGPSIYVVILNTGSEEIQVRMSAEAPLGVNINLSENDFLLKPAEQEKVFVGVDVTLDAIPGKYTLDVTAESYKQGTEGIKLMGAVGQSADLVVLGDSASVKVQTLSPTAEPVVTVVRLFKVVNNENFEVSYSNTGQLEATLSPGSYVVSSYMGGNMLAEKSFEIATGEEKTIVLTVATVFFEGFKIIPNYYPETEQLNFAELTYTINNLYQGFPAAKVLLEVAYEGSTKDEVELISIAPLETGRIGLKYNYQPKTGWKQGSYAFHLQLDIDGKVYTVSAEEVLEVGKPSVDQSGGVKSGGLPWPIIAGIVAGVIIVAGIIALVVKRKTG
jgi:hypothetical protein